MSDQNNESIPTIFIEGNVGVGKSTFLRFLKDNLDMHVLYEPTELWQDVDGNDLLEQFFLDEKRWAYTFQSYVLITRVDQLLKDNQDFGSKAIRIVERSIYSGKYCFAQVAKEIETISALEWSLYKKLWDRESIRVIQKPAGFIYLKTSYENCYKRIMSRGRFEEKPISLSYLKAIEDKHEDWFERKKGVDNYVLSLPQLILDFSQDFAANKNMQEQYLQLIKDFIAKM
ncbi:MAG: deoxynucleoside kinase [Candidatus Dependentiae bacterium]|nr:deoxynucleoside kinase [Candidatus Dependentiae bacterium]